MKLQVAWACSVGPSPAGAIGAAARERDPDERVANEGDRNSNGLRRLYDAAVWRSPYRRLSGTEPNLG